MGSKLIKVIATLGGYVHTGIEIKEDVGGLRGLFATENIPSATRLVTIPWSLIITGSNPCDCIKRLRHEITLNSSSDSIYAPYLNVIRHVEAPPYTWPHDARRLLENLPPYDFARHSQWFYQECLNYAEHDRTSDFALALYVSRSIGSPDHGFSMLPYIDLANHHSTPNIRIAYDDQGVTMLTISDLQSGDQIYTSYGFGTAELFRDYGFVEPLPQYWRISPDIAFQVLADNTTIVWDTTIPSSRQAFLDATADIRKELLIEEDTDDGVVNGVPAIINFFNKIGHRQRRDHRLHKNSPPEVTKAQQYRDNLSHAIRLAMASLPLSPLTRDVTIEL
uniref:SET domain-containing protein n=1 Tax=Aureoumbra lagunensis TaxID=44058 RepID=A0A7S3NPQ0_9STRA|mmetsp:Transcript_19007/g.28716  ORF Transcript_19007/g.28716 Transcript_19007/m.28716 type:complete len:335 (+) Transcript_19007:25-1029(+)